MQTKAKELRNECVYKLYELVKFPNQAVDIDVTWDLWRGSYPPSFVQVKMFEDSEEPVEIILSDGRHFVNGTILVGNDDHGECDYIDDAYSEGYVSLDDIDLETLCEIVDQVRKALGASSND